MAKSVHTTIWLLMSVCCHVAWVREMDQISNLTMNYRKRAALYQTNVEHMCFSLSIYHNKSVLFILFHVNIVLIYVCVFVFF